MDKENEASSNCAADAGWVLSSREREKSTRGSLKSIIKPKET